MHGEPKYPAGFDHFPYLNPDAPKGGRITFGIKGTFDSLNPLIIRGVPVWWVRGLVYESLMARGEDEPFTLYGLIADSIEVPEDRSWVEFHINPEARFSDGRPVTVEDVIFSLELLRDKGRPNHRSYYSLVKDIERLDEQTVRFVFRDASNRELPLIIGLMPVLPRHAIDPDRFESTTLEPPVGSGPYRISAVEPGRRVTFARDPDYWAADLPVSRGLYNFDEIRLDYYRDQNSMFEAFKKGLIDVYPDGDPAHWTESYDFPAVSSGQIVKEGFKDGLPKNPSGFVFNTRRPPFDDPRVREALGHLLDFEWINVNLFYGLYARTAGYFDGTELSSLGRAMDERERQILAGHLDEIRPEVAAGKWRPPVSDGSGRDRRNLEKAFALLREAGWHLQGKRLVSADGQPFRFEFLSPTPEAERIALAFRRNLQRLGIDMSIRTVDSSQYQERLRKFDFDMTLYAWVQSLSPGNEQTGRWGSQAADSEGAFNIAGIRSPAVDAAIAALLAAHEKEDFVSAARALDRALISGFYMIPLYHPPEQWVAYWNRLAHPESTPLTASYTGPSGFYSWWTRK